MSHEPRGQWLTTSQAATWLRVAPKTIRRRIERGELEARKSARDGGGVGWLVKISDQVSIETPIEEDKGAERNAHERDSEQVIDLRDEVKFLRGVIEQLQRDGAETRAALREALKLTGAAAAPQLTAGDPPEITIAPPQGEQLGQSANHKPELARGREKPSGASKSPVSYGSICDWLEEELRQRPP